MQRWVGVLVGYLVYGIGVLVRGYGDSDAVYCRRLVGYGNVESKPAGVDVCP